QADVYEVAGEILVIGPFAGGVRYNQRDLLAAQQLDEFLVEALWIADLDGMPYLLFAINIQIPWFLQPLGAALGEFGCLGSGARQTLQEILELLRIEFEIRRKLPENRPEFATQMQRSRREEVGQGFLNVAQAFG